MDEELPDLLSRGREYERVDTKWGPYWRRKGMEDPKLEAHMLSEMARLHNPIRGFFVRLLRWTEGADVWLHKRGFYVAPICCAADFSYGCPLDQALEGWLRRPWRVVSYKNYDKEGEE